MEICIQNIVNTMVAIFSNPWVERIGIAILGMTVWYGGSKLYSWLFPIGEIKLLNYARCIYDGEIREYIIEVDAWVRFRREIAVVNVDRCIKSEDNNECYSSFDSYEVIDKTGTYHMRFIPEIDEGEIATSPLNNEKARWRIIMGRSKSAPFKIKRISSQKDIVIKRVLGKVPPPLAGGDDREIKHD